MFIRRRLKQRGVSTGWLLRLLHENLLSVNYGLYMNKPPIYQTEQNDRRPLSNRNQDWFLYGNGLRHERVKDHRNNYEEAPTHRLRWCSLIVARRF